MMMEKKEESVIIKHRTIIVMDNHRTGSITPDHVTTTLRDRKSESLHITSRTLRIMEGPDLTSRTIGDSMHTHTEVIRTPTEATGMAIRKKKEDKEHVNRSLSPHHSRIPVSIQ